jgi:hypothetical protein
MLQLNEIYISDKKAVGMKSYFRNTIAIKLSKQLIGFVLVNALLLQTLPAFATEINLAEAVTPAPVASEQIAGLAVSGDMVGVIRAMTFDDWKRVAHENQSLGGMVPEVLVKNANGVPTSGDLFYAVQRIIDSPTVANHIQLNMQSFREASELQIARVVLGDYASGALAGAFACDYMLEILYGKNGILILQGIVDPDLAASKLREAREVFNSLFESAKLVQRSGGLVAKEGFEVISDSPIYIELLARANNAILGKSLALSIPKIEFDPFKYGEKGKLLFDIYMDSLKEISQRAMSLQPLSTAQLAEAKKVRDEYLNKKSGFYNQSVFIYHMIPGTNAMSYYDGTLHKTLATAILYDIGLGLAYLTGIGAALKIGGAVGAGVAMGAAGATAMIGYSQIIEGMENTGKVVGVQQGIGLATIGMSYLFMGAVSGSASRAVTATTSKELLANMRLLGNVGEFGGLQPAFATPGGRVVVSAGAREVASAVALPQAGALSPVVPIALAMQGEPPVDTPEPGTVEGNIRNPSNNMKISTIGDDVGFRVDFGNSIIIEIKNPIGSAKGTIKVSFSPKIIEGQTNASLEILKIFRRELPLGNHATTCLFNNSWVRNFVDAQITREQLVRIVASHKDEIATILASY